MAYSNDQKNEFVLRRAQGLSFNKIAQDLGISKSTLLQWQGELLNQIKEQEFYEIQDITEQFRVTRRDRFEATARLLGAVRDELARRANTEQLADMPVDKLVNLAMILEKRLLQDTGRELLNVHTRENIDHLFGTFIDAD